MAKVRIYSAMPLPVSIIDTRSLFQLSITAPAAGASLNAGTPVTVNVTTSQPASSVDFRVDGVFVASMTGAGTSWSYSWTPAAAGTPTISALGVASANSAVNTSPGVSVNVAAAAVTPASILGSQPAWWFDGSAGTLVDAGAGVCSGWTDSSGHAVNATFAGAARPAIQNTGLNGKPTLKFSATNYGGNSAYVSPAPGTTASYLFAIARIVTSISGPFILLSEGPPVGENTYCDNAGRITDNNGTAGGLSAIITVNTWYRIEVLRTNQATDYCDVNGAHTSLANAGNTSSTGFTLNANQTGGTAGTWEFAEIFKWVGPLASIPDSTKRAALAAYSAAKWTV